MDLNAARMFVAAVQAGSLSAAAARLDMALPTLSRRIRELEAELNVRLLERNARGVRLTDAGTRLFEEARLRPRMKTHQTQLRMATSCGDGRLTLGRSRPVVAMARTMAMRSAVNLRVGYRPASTSVGSSSKPG